MEYDVFILLLGSVLCTCIYLLNRNRTGIWGCLAVLVSCGCGLALYYNVQWLKNVSTVQLITVLSAVLLMLAYIMALIVEKRYNTKKEVMKKCATKTVKRPAKVMPQPEINDLETPNITSTEEGWCIEKEENVLEGQQNECMYPVDTEGVPGGGFEIEETHIEVQTTKESARPDDVAHAPAAQGDIQEEQQGECICLDDTEGVPGNGIGLEQIHDQAQTIEESAQPESVPLTPEINKGNIQYPLTKLENQLSNINTGNWLTMLRKLMTELAPLAADEQYRAAQSQIRDMIRDGCVLPEKDKQQAMLVLKLIREKGK